MRPRAVAVPIDSARYAVPRLPLDKPSMRATCYRCFWPRTLCWCDSIIPMETRTRFVFLMHPKEYKQEKAATGRLTHLCLTHSEVQVGVEFDNHESVQELINDPANLCVLLHPGRDAINLSDSGETER